jgi:hypothetical protein
MEAEGEQFIIVAIEQFHNCIGPDSEATKCCNQKYS